MAVLTGIKLTWEDKNDFEAGFKLYRSLTPFDQNNLPAVLVDLPPNTQQYIDTDVLENTTYYYMLSTYVAGKEVFTPNIESISVDQSPGPIGTATEGGYVIGHITLDASYGVDEGTYAIVMAPASAEANVSWKNSTTDTPNTSDLNDGLSNTYACISANSDITPIVTHPAAQHCVNYEGGGYTDWYLPSKNELNLARINRNELSALAMTGSYYWSSSQATASTAWNQHMINGNQTSESKTATYRVRPVRRLKIL